MNEVELEIEDLQEMICHPLQVGAAWFYHDPKSTDTSHAGLTTTWFQGTTFVIIAIGENKRKGERVPNAITTLFLQE